MFKRFIRNVFKIGNTDLFHKMNAIAAGSTSKTGQHHSEILNSFSTAFEELRILHNEIRKIHRVQKQLLDKNKESDILTRRERLALDYALIRPTLGSLNYPTDDPKGRMTRRNHKDIAKECVLYADKIIEVSETPADDYRRLWVMP